MEAALAIAGGVLLVLSLGGGVKRLSTRVAEKDEYVPMGDRRYAAALGFDLVALAVAVEAEWPAYIVGPVLGLGGLIALDYARFLWRSDRTS